MVIIVYRAYKLGNGLYLGLERVLYMNTWHACVMNTWHACVHYDIFFIVKHRYS